MSDSPDRGRRPSGSQAAQVARNEVRFRRVNEAIDAGRAADGGPQGFVCECGHLGCTTVIAVPAPEYRAVRSDFRRFVVAPGHELDADEVVEDRGGYLVVAKHGTGADIARDEDPRMQEDAG